MIHIATVHWKTDKWVDIQLKYFNRYIQDEFRVYAFLNDLPEGHEGKFYYCSTEPIQEHAIKLNLLAERISWEANESDILIFMDGDAFPIHDNIMPFIRSKVALHELIAIQRVESLGDKQPHPCFCATTVGFWNKIKGDWKMGYLWKDKTGMPVTDVGGNMLLKLEERGTNWLPLHRTNKKNLHPLWFGVYENLIYHHGSGFVAPFSRVDREQKVETRFLFRLIWVLKSLVAIAERKFETAKTPVIQESQRIEKEFFRKIEKDDFFYQELIQ